MPTLRQRNDGGYYILHFYRDHSTWQISGGGVRFLQRRQINVDDQFSTELFMDLWDRNLVYYGTELPRDPVPFGGGQSESHFTAVRRAT
jgi:hypothetical protein